MATYFNGNSEYQPPDGLQTLILMNPGGIQYSDTPPQASSNLVFFNSPAGNRVSSPNLPYAPLSQPQYLVGIPLTAAISTDANSLSSHYHRDVYPLHGFIQRSQNRFWSSNDHPSTVARDSPRIKQGLSLTLASHQPGYGLVRIPSEAQQEVPGENVHITCGSSSASGVTVPSVQSMPLRSKYLRVAQELLDELTNVGNNGVKKETLKKTDDRRTKQEEESMDLAGDKKDGGEGSAKTSSELSPAERQEIQMKKAQFVNMLDELEQGYRQYHHQMQILVSSFEQTVGVGSARTYTALALQTISKQFRCLKDTITAQIRLANKNLGKEDGHGGKIEGSKLRFVDHHFHQQRALQNLGMIQHNAWRPQRGLPERSVSVLRAWLFEHFLHPYPKDSDKQMLAKQTGLTRSQVSNWFINARVRLWKPMVEDMYMEETKRQEQNLSAEKTSKSNDEYDTTSKSTTPTPQDENHPINYQLPSFNSKQDDLHQPVISFSSSPTSLQAINVGSQSGFCLIGSSELDGITQGSQKRQRIAELMQSPKIIPTKIDTKPGEAINEPISMKFDSEMHSRDGYSFIGGQANFIGGFEQFPTADIERFDAEPFPTRFSSNGVALTLGLPHSENLTSPVANHNFLPNQNINLGRNSFDQSTYQHHPLHLHSATLTYKAEKDLRHNCCPSL